MDRWWWKMWKRYMTRYMCYGMSWALPPIPALSHRSIGPQPPLVPATLDLSSSRATRAPLAPWGSTGAVHGQWLSPSHPHPPVPRLQTTPRCVPFWKIDVLFIVHVIYIYLLYSNLRTCTSLSLSIDRHLPTHVNTKTCSFMFHFRRISSRSLQTTTM